MASIERARLPGDFESAAPGSAQSDGLPKHLVVSPRRAVSLAIACAPFDESASLFDRIATIDPAGILEFQRCPEDREIQKALGAMLVSENGYRGSRFEQLVDEVTSLGDRRDFVRGLRSLFSIVKHFTAISPVETLSTDRSGEPLTLGELLHDTMQKTVRSAEDLTEVLGTLGFEVPNNHEWRSAKNEALFYSICEFGYGKGFFHLCPTGSDMQAMGSLFFPDGDQNSHKATLSDALKSVSCASSYEEATIALVDRLYEISLDPARTSSAVVVSCCLFATLRDAMSMAEFYQGDRGPRHRNVRSKEVNLSLLSAALHRLGEIPVDADVRIGKPCLHDAFTRLEFDSFRELLEYANPARVAGWSDGLMHWASQQQVAIALFQWLDSVGLDQITRHAPTAVEARQLLEIPTLFPRGQLHEYPSGTVVLDTIDNLAHALFARIASPSEWLEVASFKAQKAAQFESQRIKLIASSVEKLVMVSTSTREVIETLEAVKCELLSPFLMYLKALPDPKLSLQNTGRVVRCVVSTLRSFQEDSASLKPFAGALALVGNKAIKSYESELSSNVEGRSEEELRALQRELRGVTWRGRALNGLLDLRDSVRRRFKFA